MTLARAVISSGLGSNPTGELQFGRDDRWTQQPSFDKGPTTVVLARRHSSNKATPLSSRAEITQ